MARTYDLANVTTTGTAIVNDGITIKNASLRKATQNIAKLMLAMKNNYFGIAVEIKKIYDGKMFEADGFESIEDYTSQVFGYKKAMTYNLIKVASKFLVTDGNTVHSIIKHDGNDYTVSQLQEVITIEPSEVITLDANAVISPEMTTKEIRKAVKEYKQGATEGATEGEGEGATAEVSTDVEKLLKSAIRALGKLVDCDGLSESARADCANMIETLKQLS